MDNALPRSTSIVSIASRQLLQACHASPFIVVPAQSLDTDANALVTATCCIQNLFNNISRQDCNQSVEKVSVVKLPHVRQRPDTREVAVPGSPGLPPHDEILFSDILYSTHVKT